MRAWTRVAYEKAKKLEAGKRGKDGDPKRGGDKARGEGQSLNGLNPRTDRRNR